MTLVSLSSHELGLACQVMRNGVKSSIIIYLLAQRWKFFSHTHFNYARKSVIMHASLFARLLHCHQRTTPFNYPRYPFLSPAVPFSVSIRHSQFTTQHDPHPSSNQSLVFSLVKRSNQASNSPVIKLLASLIKNAAAPRYSSGLLNLPNIFCFGQSSLLSGNFSKRASTIAVTM